MPLFRKLMGELGNEDYLALKKFTGETIEKLETRLSELAVVNVEIKGLLKSGLKKIANIDSCYKKGDIEKRELL